MSSSTELWRHLPLLFQRSLTFCKTSSVIYRLQQQDSNLKSLRLVGVEDTVCIHALSDALRQNTTLQHVSICGSFLQTLVLSPEASLDLCPIILLFQAIGSLPHLVQLTLQGNEDAEAFPVAALTRLLLQQKQQPTLQALSCQYIDLVASSEEEMTELGMALQQCTSLQKVQMTSLRLDAGGASLDPILSSLGHVRSVEFSMRHRTSISDDKVFESLLGGPNSNLQSLILGRRIALSANDLDAILQCLSLNNNTNLQELQIDHVDRCNDVTWGILAKVLQHSKSSLRSLDITVCTPSHTGVQHLHLVTTALQHNTTLKKLCLRGAFPDHDILDRQYRPFLQVVQHDNTTLEELVLTHPEEDAKNRTDVQRKLQFFLLLNKQQVDGSGFRTRLRQCNEAIPQQFMLPCLMAARQVDTELEKLQRLEQTAWEDDDEEDDELLGEEEETDFYGYVYHSSWHASQRQPTQQQQRQTSGSMSALYYLLRQQPSLVSFLQQASERQPKQPPRQTGGQQEPDGPQLLLLDDDIITLW